LVEQREAELFEFRLRRDGAVPVWRRVI